MLGQLFVIVNVQDEQEKKKEMTRKKVGNTQDVIIGIAEDSGLFFKLYFLQVNGREGGKSYGEGYL